MMFRFKQWLKNFRYHFRLMFTRCPYQRAERPPATKKDHKLLVALHQALFTQYCVSNFITKDKRELGTLHFNGVVFAFKFVEEGDSQKSHKMCQIIWGSFGELHLAEASKTPTVFWVDDNGDFKIVGRKCYSGSSSTGIVERFNSPVVKSEIDFLLDVAPTVIAMCDLMVPHELRFADLHVPIPSRIKIPYPAAR